MIRRIVAITAAAMAAYFGYAIYRAAKSERQATAEVATAGHLRFDDRILDTTPPAGMDLLRSSAGFRDAALFNGQLYIASTNTLLEYHPDGVLAKEYRCGFELPAAPLLALSVSPTALWIATGGEGFLEFDGARFRHIRPDLDRRVNAILPLASGVVLIGTAEHGVLRFDGSTLTPFHPSLEKLHVTALAGSEESVWIGTRDDGAWQLAAGRALHFDALPDPHVSALAVDGEMAWAGTPAGAAEFRSGRFTRNVAAGYFINSLYADANELLAGTLEDGLVRIGLNAKRSEAGKGEVRRVLSLNGVRYLLTPASLETVDRREALVTADPSALTDVNISALAIDSQGQLWAGYFDRGLDLLDSAARRVRHVEDEHVFCVNRILPGAYGGLTAIATANGLVLAAANGEPKQVYMRADGLIASAATDILPYNGGLAIATAGGITFFDRGGMRSVFAFQGLVNNHVYTLAPYGRRLLAGTLGGVSILEGESVRESFTASNSALGANWVTALVPVGREVFAGTYGRGIFRLDENRVWHNFADMPGNIVVNPNAMLATQMGVYAGTLANGLLFQNASTGRWREIHLGLPGMSVTALAIHGTILYIGTDNGLVRASESALTF